MGEFDDLIPGATPRTGYIPGVPKAKDPLDIKAKELEIKSKELSIAEAERKATQPGSGGQITENESKSSMFLRRMLGSNQEYNTLGVGPRGVANETIADFAPGLLRNLPEGVGGDDNSRKLADRAMRDFIGASLRYESGASINKDEFAKQLSIFYPHSGEADPGLQGAYKEARKRAIEGMIAATGRAMTPELQAEVDKWRGAQGAGQPEQALPPGSAPEQMDALPPAMAGPGQDQMTLAQGRLHSEDDPALAGVNAKLNAMVKGGASPNEIAAWLKSAGIPPQEVMPSVMQALQFRAKNPNYHGDYNVNVDDRMVPSSVLSQVGASAPGAGVIAAVDTLTGGHLDNIVGASGGNAEMANIGIGASRSAHGPASFVGDLAGGAALYATGAGIAGRAGLAAGEGVVGALSPGALLGDAALGGYVSSGQGGTQIAAPGQMAMGAGIGALTGGAARGALNSAGAAISPNGGALAPLYEAGARPSIGQRVGAAGGPISGIVGRATNRAEQAFGSVFMAGGIQRSSRNASISQMQKGAFNDALGDIGMSLPKGIQKGTQAHKFMQKAFDDVYDRARSGMQFAPDGEWGPELGALQRDASLLNKDSGGIFKKILFDVGAKLRASGGALSGEQYKLVVSQISKKVSALRSNQSGDTELADVLESLKTAIDDGARRQSNPEAVALLDAADRGYAKAVVIENAGKLRGGDAGEFNGNQLDRAVQSTNKSRRSRAYQRGEATMQEYAAAAKKLGDDLPDSGSPERLVAMTAGMGGLGAINPYLVTPWALNTAANLPGVRQTLGHLMAPHRSGVRAYTDPTRNLLEELAPYGSVSVAPSAN